MTRRLQQASGCDGTTCTFMAKQPAVRASDDPVARFLALLRTTTPDFQFVYTHGGCYHLYRMLKVIWPQAELWYVKTPGHVYTKIGRCWYDIRGRRQTMPQGAKRMTAKQIGRPHRWNMKLSKWIDDLLVAEAAILEKAVHAKD